MRASTSGSTPHLLSHRSFARFWGARFSGAMANQMMLVALGWQMYDLTASAWDLGLVGLYQFLPALLLVLVAGHVVDRFHRGRIAALCMVAQCLLAGVLVTSTHGDWASRELLLALSLGLGTVRAFQMPAQQALPALLVPREMLPRAMSFSSAGMQVAIIGGPALGGFIYVAGASVVYAVCAVLLALAAVLFGSVSYEHAVPPRQPVSFATLSAGVRFIWHRPDVLGAISLDLFAVLLGGATALLPMFAKDILHVDTWGLGLLRAAPAVGALATSIVLTHWPIRRRAGGAMFTAVAVYGVATMVFGLSTGFELSWLALMISGAADMVSVVIRQSLVQLDTPDDMRGRVSAVNAVFIGASNQLGEFESGATAAWLGPVGSVVLGGAGSLAVALMWMRLFPGLMKRRQLLVPG